MLLYENNRECLTELLQGLSATLRCQKLGGYYIGQKQVSHTLILYWLPLLQYEGDIFPIVAKCQKEIVANVRSETSVAELQTEEETICEPTAFALTYRIAMQIVNECWDNLIDLDTESTLEEIEEAAALVESHVQSIYRDSAERLHARLRRECLLLNVEIAGPDGFGSSQPSKTQVDRVREAMLSLPPNPTKESVKAALRAGGQKAFRDTLIGKAIDIVNGEQK